MSIHGVAYKIIIFFLIVINCALIVYHVRIVINNTHKIENLELTVKDLSKEIDEADLNTEHAREIFKQKLDILAKEINKAAATTEETRAKLAIETARTKEELKKKLDSLTNVISKNKR